MNKRWLLLALFCLWITPAINAHARSAPKELKLDSRSRTELSRFFQDIVSSNDEDFRRGKAPNKVLVSFGIYYLGLRQPKLFKNVKDPHYVPIRIEAKHVEAVVTQFFNLKMKRQSIEDWKYKNRFYTGDAASLEQLDAEEIKKFTIFDHGNGLYVAYVNFVDSMATATSEPEKEVIVKTRMTLKKISSQGKSRYILMGYKTLTPRI